jgi:hypothetical protein
MGNNPSIIKNKNNQQSRSFKQLNNDNTEFVSKLNEIATNYILGQNFKDMTKLTNSKYCDDLVIITSKILKKSFFSNQIKFIYNTLLDGKTSRKLDGYRYEDVDGDGDGDEDEDGESQKDNPIFSNVPKEQTKKMCIEIAKYYVKVAHLFSAIITTLNPVFSWKSSASSSRAVLTPYIPMSADAKDKMARVARVERVDDMTGEGLVDVEKSQNGEIIENAENIEKIEKTTLENKHYISEMAKNVKVENLNFCNSRIADLIDMDELTDIINDTGIGNDLTKPSEIKIKTKLCSSHLNNGSLTDTTRRTKTVYDLPGFAELSRLYNDTYNTSKGRFDRMSAKSRAEKKRNVDLLYTLFTGNPNPPKDIKHFRDIPIHSFSDTADCSGVNSMLNKTYIGTTKDKLFVEYVEQIKKMIYDSNMIRNSLLEIIDKIFIVNTDETTDETIDETTETSKTKYIIDPNLTYEELNNLIDETRKIILKLYINCEKNFIYTLKILQAIIESQIFETNQLQIRELERNIETEYAT